MRNSSSLDWLRFMHTPNDYRVSPFHCSKSDAKVSRKRDAKQSLSIGKNKTTKMRYIDMYNTYI